MPTAHNRILHQCEKQNITELQVHECRIRLVLQTRHDAATRLETPAVTSQTVREKLSRLKLEGKRTEAAQQC